MAEHATEKRKETGLDLNSLEVVNFLNSQKEKYDSLTRHEDAQGNETQRGLSSQLMLITTVLMTITVVVLGNGDLAKQLTCGQRYFLVLIFILEILATIAGIAHYLLDERSHRKWADVHSYAADLISKVDFYDIPELSGKVTEMQSKLPVGSPRYVIWAQITFILLTFVVYFLLLSAILFDWNGILLLRCHI